LQTKSQSVSPWMLFSFFWSLAKPNNSSKSFLHAIAANSANSYQSNPSFI
jgi:hypothetical protein